MTSEITQSNVLGETLVRNRHFIEISLIVGYPAVESFSPARLGEKVP